MGQSTDGILFYGYCWTDEEVDTEEWPEEAKELYGKEHEVLIGSHCSCDYPMPYIYVQSTEITAARGYPQKIDVEAMSFAPKGQWDKQLDAFVEKWGIDVSEAEGPGWFLCSMWC